MYLHAPYLKYFKILAKNKISGNKESIKDKEEYLQSLKKGQEIARIFKEEGVISGDLIDLESYQDIEPFARFNGISPEELLEIVSKSVEFIAGSVDDNKEEPTVE